MDTTQDANAIRINWGRHMFGRCASIHFRSVSFFFPILSLLFVLGCSKPKSSTTNTNIQAADLGTDSAILLVEAAQANASHNIRLEQQILERVIKLAPRSRDAAKAERSLGKACWRYYKAYEQARTHFRNAANMQEVAFDAWIEEAEMELSLQHYAEARKAVEAALSAAQQSSEKLRAQAKLAQAAVDEAVLKRLAGSAVQSNEINRAFKSLQQLVETQPGWESASRLYLQAALLISNGPAALAAWQSYFHVSDGVTLPGTIAEAGKELTRLLTNWREPGDADSQLALICALGNSRLFHEAAIVALDPRPAFKEVFIALLSMIDINLMPWSAPSSGDHEKFSIYLKAFIGVAVTTEEYPSLLGLNEGIGKVGFDLLVWTNYPAICKRWLVTTDNDMVDSFVRFKFLKFV